MNKKIEFDSFIKGELVDLVVLTEEVIDKTNWYKWFNDEENTKYMQQHYYPNTKEKQFKFFRDKIKGDDAKVQLGIVRKSDNLFSGVISLTNINYLNGSCEIGLIIGESEARKLQYFLEATKLMCHHAFNTLNMNRIYSGTTSKEIDQLFCRVFGFKHEGVLKQAVFKDGSYHDVYQHALLRENYKKP
jgi:[ribosomal protein S5]-alanine N-acetyltransferase